MTIGKKLKEARVKAGLTQETVSEAIQVSRQTISNWENEKTYPDIGSVIRLSDLYGVSLDALLRGDEGLIQHLDGRAKRRTWAIRLGAAALGALLYVLLLKLAVGIDHVFLVGNGLTIDGRAAAVTAVLVLLAALAYFALTLWKLIARLRGRKGHPGAGRAVRKQDALRLAAPVLAAALALFILW